jgi:hypothetical protein
VATTLATKHGWLRFDSKDLGDRGRVVAKVETIAGAYLDDPAGQPGQQLLAVLGSTCLLCPD